jgi:SNF2 family DNA or RNA helicase
MSPDEPIELRLLDDRTVELRAHSTLSPKHRLFVKSVLGGVFDDEFGNWRLPLRNLTPGELLSRLVQQFERDKINVVLLGDAEKEAQEEVERLRSFRRTLEQGRTFQASGTTLARPDIDRALALVGWDFDSRKLRPHQLGAVAHALEVLNVANFSVPGAGKTATSLAVYAAHLAEETVDLAVVIGPLASFAPWEGEAAAALPGVLRVRRVRGVNSQARSTFYRLAEPRDLLLLTYPTVVADLAELVRLAQRHKLLLIIDESHRIKRFRGGQWAPAMVQLASAAKVRMILSGTPMPQSPLDLWSQFNVLWPKQELTGSRESFKARSINDFGALIADVSPIFTRTPKAALDIPPYHVEYVPCALPPLQAEVLELITNRFRRQLDDADDWQSQLSALRKARPLRLLQAASNPDLLNETDGFFGVPPLEDDGGTLMQRLADYRNREIPGKFAEAVRILDDQIDKVEKTVVWTSFIRNIDQFADLCRRKFDVPVYTVDGRVPVDTSDSEGDFSTTDDPGDELDSTREARIRSFLSSPRPAILIANPAACGESISLHKACTTAVYLDRTYDCARYLQSVDRIHRLGLKPDDQVVVYVLQAEVDGQPTVDGLVQGSLDAKSGRMEQLLEGGELLPSQIPPDAEAATGNDQDLGALLRHLLGR